MVKEPEPMAEADALPELPARIAGYTLLTNTAEWEEFLRRCAGRYEFQPENFPCFVMISRPAIPGVQEAQYNFLYKRDLNALFLAFAAACRPEGEALDKSAWLALHPITKKPTPVVTADWFHDVQKGLKNPVNIGVG